MVFKVHEIMFCLHKTYVLVLEKQCSRFRIANSTFMITVMKIGKTIANAMINVENKIKLKRK